LVVVFIQDRQLCADGFIVRAQLTIRADGPPAAPDLRLHFDTVGFVERRLRAPRANPVFRYGRKTCPYRKTGL